MPGVLSEQQVDWIRTSYEVVRPQADELAGTFVTTLLLHVPQIRPLFPDDEYEQRSYLREALELMVVRADDLETIRGSLYEMGRRHVEQGVTPDQYPSMCDVMIASLRSVATNLWSDELEDAWTTLLHTVAGIMLEGAERAATKDAA